jgi:glycosyltransferase involved in cell wall biosynthesis
MKVLHIRNVANVANTLAQFQKELGHEAFVIGITKTNLYHEDLNIGLNLEYNKFELLNRFTRIVKTLIKNRKYDVFHLHNGGIFPWDSDIPLWFRRYGTTIVHWHGGKLRNNPNLFGAKFANKVIVSTPDLLKFTSNGVWIPNPIDLGKFPYVGVKKKPDMITIVHAPTRRSIKGTEYLINAVESLKNDGYKNINLKIVEKEPYDKAIEIYKQADIIVDQLLIGWYGMLAIEGMALGKPVCCYIRNDLESLIHSLPILNISQRNIRATLQELIEDEILREKIGKKGREYVKNSHDAKMVTKKVCELY